MHKWVGVAVFQWNFIYKAGSRPEFLTSTLDPATNLLEMQITGKNLFKLHFGNADTRIKILGNSIGQMVVVLQQIVKKGLQQMW